MRVSLRGVVDAASLPLHVHVLQQHSHAQVETKGPTLELRNACCYAETFDRRDMEVLHHVEAMQRGFVSNLTCS